MAFAELKAALEEMSGDPATSRKRAFLFDPGSDAKSKRLVRTMLLDRGFQEVKDDVSSSASVEAMRHTGQQFARIAIGQK
jgi:hypothetical protein